MHAASALPALFWLCYWGDGRMDPKCFEHVLTENEREKFEHDGFLMVENAIPQELVDDLIPIVDRIDRAERPVGARDRGEGQSLRLHRQGRSLSGAHGLAHDFPQGVGNLGLAHPAVSHPHDAYPSRRIGPTHSHSTLPHANQKEYRLASRRKNRSRIGLSPIWGRPPSFHLISPASWSPRIA